MSIGRGHHKTSCDSQIREFSLSTLEKSSVHSYCLLFVSRKHSVGIRHRFSIFLFAYHLTVITVTSYRRKCDKKGAGLLKRPI